MNPGARRNGSRGAKGHSSAAVCAIDPADEREPSPSSGCGRRSDRLANVVRFPDWLARLTRMTSEMTRINPAQLHPTPGYHHITVVEAGRMAFLAGQVPLDRSGALVGPGDLDAQIDQVAANSIAALSAVGARPDHVVRSVIYVVSGDVADLSAAWHRLNGSVIGSAFTAASTLLGVAQLGFPGQLIEVDLTAVLSG